MRADHAVHYLDHLAARGNRERSERPTVSRWFLALGAIGCWLLAAMWISSQERTNRCQDAALESDRTVQDRRHRDLMARLDSIERDIRPIRLRIVGENK